MAKPSIECLILAAGASRRFGSHKMLYELPNGKRMIEQTLEIYLSVFDRVSLVCDPSDTELIQLLDAYPANIVYSLKSEGGLSQSIVVGVQANPNSAAWLIALGDMPYIKSESVRTIENVLDANSVVVPRYNGRQGNPVGFGRFAKESLLRLSGDTGAKVVIQEYLNRVEYLDLDDEGVVLDIDCPTAVIVED